MALIARRKWQACFMMKIIDDWDGKRMTARAVTEIVQPLQHLFMNPLVYWIAAFDRTNVPYCVRLYLEFESPRVQPELPWESRHCTTTVASTPTVVHLLRLDDVLTNVQNSGPLAALTKIPTPRDADLIARAAMAYMCTRCGKAHPTDCGNPECSAAACLTPLSSLFACLSCSTAFCCRRCTDSHYCLVHAVVSSMPLGSTIVVRHSSKPFASPPDLDALFSGYRFGGELTAVARDVRVAADDVEAYATTLCDNVGTYATFRHTGTPAYSIAARAYYASVCRLPSATVAAAKIARATAARETHAACHLKQEAGRALALAMTPPFARTCELSHPLSLADAYYVHDAMAAYADDERALCQTVAAMFPPKFAALLNEICTVMPLRVADTPPPAIRLGIHLLRLFAMPENRTNERLYEIGCHLMRQQCTLKNN